LDENEGDIYEHDEDPIDEIEDIDLDLSEEE
jgi:hypothetical protein